MILSTVEKLSACISFSCGNVNWARRGDCNMCQTPKFGVQEERTGLGGGFNERDNVEYNETVVSYICIHELMLCVLVLMSSNSLLKIVLKYKKTL